MKKKLSMKMGAIALGALVCGMTVAGCSFNDSGKADGQGQAADNTGSVGLNLTLSSGAVITSVQAVVSGSALSAPITRTIPVAGNQSTVSALFGGLPAGTYSIALSASTADGKTDCGGTANFTVLAGQTVGVTVPLTCNTDVTRGNVLVNGQFNSCPELTFVYVAPLQTDVGLQMVVEADATDADGDTVTYAWTATDGTFVSPSSGDTSYNCSASGDQTLTLTINDGGNCATSLAVDVVCVATAVCGDGNAETAKGEECDPPNGTTCSTNCQDIVVACGNGIVQPGEQCDPANGTTCNAQCKNIVCGDGVVEGTEQCEPPGTARGLGNCDALCKVIPSVCGNNIIEPGEECEGPGTAACSATCQNTGASACQVCQGSSCPGPLADQTTRCAGGVCDAYLACQASSGCAASDVRACYCGAVDFTTCFGFDPATPQGPCKAQINNLAGSTTPLQVGTRFFDPSGPLGAVNQVNLCTANNCGASCP